MINSYPIRRFITTNTESSENYELLIGLKWHSLERAIDTIRMHVLLCPPPGSLSHTEAQEFDRWYPDTRWMPRGPSQEEKEELNRIK